MNQPGNPISRMLKREGAEVTINEDMEITIDTSFLSKEQVKILLRELGGGGS